MRNLLLTLRYDGADYHGWQVQDNARTVQSVFQEALINVLGERPDIKGCSRTDSGVHARKFCVSLKTDRTIPCKKLIPALNVNLPEDIAVTDCREVSEDFHARYSAKGKRYVYVIHNSPVRDPFLSRRALEHKTRLNENKMNVAAQHFVGTHDFAAFCSAGSKVTDTVRTVKCAKVEREGDIVRFTVAADGFLYNMVRIMTGTLLEVSAGKIMEDEVPDIIASRDRSRAGITAPACGLYLDEVFYEDGSEQ